MGARMQSIAVQGLLVLPALVFWPGARDAFLAPPWAVAGALAAAGSLVWMLRGAPGWTAVPLVWRLLAGAGLGWTALRVPGSVDPWMGAVHGVESLVVALAAGAGLGLAARDRARAEAAIAFAVTLVCAIALVEFALGRFPLLPDAASATSMPGRPGSTLGNPVFLGGWLAAVLPVLLAGRSRLAGIAAPLATAAIVLTGSRGALIAGLAGAAWTAWRGAVPRSMLMKPVLAAVAAAVVLAAARPATLAHLGTPALAGRAEIWRATAGMIRSAPLLGVGTGGFGAAYPCAQRSAGAWAWSPTLFAHNEYLHALAETGPVGLVLLIWWGVLVLRARPRDPAGAGAQGGVVALAVGALFAFPLHLPATRLLWWLLPAVWLTPSTPGRPARFRPLLLALGVPLAVVAAVGASRLLVRNAELRAGIALKDAGEFAPADLRFAAALRLLPDTSRDRIGMQRAITTFAAGALGETEAQLDADEPRFPCTAEAVWYRAFAGVMRVAAGQRHAAGAAEEQIALGLSLGPPTARAAGFWTLRGHLHASLGDRPGARQAYRAALELDPAHRDARANLDRLSGR